MIFPSWPSISLWSGLLYFILAVIILEGAFYMYVNYVVYPDFNRTRLVHWDRQTQLNIMQKIIHVYHALKEDWPYKTLLEQSFFNVKFESLNVNDVLSYLSYSFHNKKLHEQTTDEAETTQELFKMIDENFDLQLKQGPLTNDCCTKYGHGDIPYKHRSLCFYLIMRTLRQMGEIQLFLSGFRKYHLGDTIYWYRKCPEQDETHLPMVFYHGVTVGWPLYKDLVDFFANGRTVILVDIPHFSMSLDFNVQSPEEHVADMEQILYKHDLTDVVVVGHSFGSVYANWTGTGLRSHVKQLVLLDPITFLIFFPKVINSFCYRSPRSKLKKFLFEIFTKEITISALVRRYCRWQQLVLFPEDIHCPTVVVLSGKDGLVPSDAVRHYLTLYRDQPDRFDVAVPPEKMQEHKEMIKILYVEDFAHAQILKPSKEVRSINAVIRDQEVNLVRRRKSSV